MFNWFFALQNCLAAVVWRWHQWLPALRYFLVLAVLVTGLGINAPGLRMFSLTRPLAAVRNEAGSSFVRLFSSPHQQNQSFDAGGDLSQRQGPPALSVNKELFSVLKEPRPWGGGTIALSPLSVPSRMPGKIGGVDSEDRKRLFIDILLPTVMVALDEVRQERQQLLAIIAELGLEPPELSFAEDQLDWQYRLGGDKSKFILGLTRKYRTESAAELVVMVNVLPPSLVIAQGALESAWGASRFAVEVNNLFGMYSSAGASLSKSHNGAKVPKIMEYDSILESVRAYVLNINRLSAYKELRRIRCQTLDPMLIADGLTQYSERKKYYIADVKHIIVRNNLQDYDALITESV